MTDRNPHIPNETQYPNTAEESHKQQRQEHQEQKPQSPRTLTLTDQYTQIQTLPDPNPNQDEDIVMEDPIHNTNDEPEPDTPHVVTAATSASSAPGRRAPNRKKQGAKRTAQEKRSREKLQVLVETLKLVPFVPAKALDFDCHQSLLQRLGLWDFIHLNFDTTLRSDLVAELIASYIPASRCSYVSGVRINVSRADLGRALMLPKKNAAAAGVAPTSEESGEAVDLAESISFAEDFVENWMLLHDDAYILPNEVLAQLILIKEGQLEKVDWASLMWAMLDKELRSTQLLNCYYASHLQRLIRTQHSKLLDEEEEEEEGEEVGGNGEGEEIEVKDEKEEDEESVVAAAGEAVDAISDVKMVGLDDERGQVSEMEEHSIELNLGQENVERADAGQDNAEMVDEGKELVGGEQIMGFEPSKVEESGLWLMVQKNNLEEPFLQPCQTSDVKGVNYGPAKEDEGEEGQEHEEEEEEDADVDVDADAEEDEHEGGFTLSPKCIPMEGVSSGAGGLMQAMEGAQMPFSSGIDLRDNPVGDFLSSRDDPQMISGSSLFGNDHKREVSLDHTSHHSLHGSNKRMRGDSPWNSKPLDFEICMENIQSWMGKARMMYAAKEQACEESTMNQQVFLNELQKRDEMIELFHKAKMDDSHKRQMEIYRLEKELFMMSSLMEGYRKALNETHKTFDEYRARCPQADEPLYKDVPGSGGLVLSVMELEKEQLRKEEEERIKQSELLRDFEQKSGIWIGKLEDHLCSLQSLDNRLLAAEEQVKHWNEVKAKSKLSDPYECAPTSEEQNA